MLSPSPDDGACGNSVFRVKSALRGLVDESVTIIREVAAEFERPVMLFSGGKDSVVMLHLAVRAFAPARVPFPVMHIDTGHNFAEVIEYRDRTVAALDVRLIVGSVQASIDAGRVQDATGPRASRNPLQTVTLLDSIAEHKFDAVFGGARRDEERARAKERVYSFRDSFGQWDPRTQRPELWGIYNGRHQAGAEYDIELPSIYYAHRRRVFRRDGMWMAVSPFLQPADDEQVSEQMVRFRTVGDATCTAAIESSATTIDQVIAETAAARITERGATRADDRISEAGMEDRKKQGYF
ncbi:MAG: sulfate adenylyltransferase subunit 2 [Actinobacteria bacterium]|nr:sulfate adenylyltransferase subunit 2 [Actinomycetota bacterium]